MSVLRIGCDNQRGLMLPVCLITLVLVGIMATAVVMTTRKDIQTGVAYTNSVTAFNLAEAGVSIAKQTLKNSSNWNILLAASQPFVCPSLVLSGGGGCIYRIENDAGDGGGPTTDTNNTVVVKVTGQYRGSNKEIHAAFRRSGIPLPSAGLTSTGIGATLDYSGSDNEINGNNWIPPSDDGSTPAVQDNNACGPGTGPKFGIAVRDATQQQALKDIIDPANHPSVTGAAPNPPWSPPSATPSIGVDGAIMSQVQLESLANELIAKADLTYPPGTTVMSQTLSTQAAPKIVAVDCTGYTGLAACLKLDGTTKGAGMLVVKSGKLHLRATASWTGIVIVVGNNVAFETGGGGGPGNILYGGVLIGENTAVQPQWYKPRNTKLRYSCDAINMANKLTTGAGAPRTLWWKDVM
jgi:hypothetical protein